MDGIFLNVFSVAGDVGDGEKFGEFTDDAVFVVHAEVADFLGDLIRIQFVWALGRCGNSLRGTVIGKDGSEYGEQ